MPENLLESELFGHKKGSVHRRARGEEGPLRDRRRRHALPRRGDGDAAVAAERSSCACCRRGRSAPSARRRRSASTCASSPRRTATSRRRSPEGRFREDLYYRLKVFPHPRAAAARAPRGHPAPRRALPRRATRPSSASPRPASRSRRWSCSRRYDWPGNVRELQNEVQRLVIQIEPGGFVTPDLLSPRIRQVEGVIERVKPDEGDAQGDDGPARAVAPHRGAARARQQQDGRGARRSGSRARGCTRSSAGSGCERRGRAPFEGRGRGALAASEGCSSGPPFCS